MAQNPVTGIKTIQANDLLMDQCMKSRVEGGSMPVFVLIRVY